MSQVTAYARAVLRSMVAPQRRTFERAVRGRRRWLAQTVWNEASRAYEAEPR